MSKWHPSDIEDEYPKVIRDISEVCAFIRNRAIDKLCAEEYGDDMDEMIYAKEDLLKTLANYFGYKGEDVWPSRKF